MNVHEATEHPHYHVFHGLPGYLPNGDVPEPGIGDVRQAMLVLAEELSTAVDGLIEQVNYGGDDVVNLEEEADGLYALAQNLESAAHPWPGTDRYPGTVTIGDGVRQVSSVAKYGLMIDVGEGERVATRYELQPCWETECGPEEE